ncbi:MAG: redoxin domain-containing protein [Fimbriimonadaceae bacterium]|nr:redoxin domain-containing protein [Fimbriimonadaceae bacterium]
MKACLCLAFACLVASILGAVRPIPSFRLAGSDGKTYTKAEVTRQPTVLVFMSVRCPHNVAATGDLNRFAASLGKSVRVVGVTNATLAETKALAKTLKASFPILADPAKELIKGMGAKHSLDTAFVSPVAKAGVGFWEGYSRETFRAIVDLLPKHGGPKRSPNLSGYPAAMQSGCSF